MDNSPSLMRIPGSVVATDTYSTLGSNDDISQATKALKGGENIKSGGSEWSAVDARRSEGYNIHKNLHSSGLNYTKYRAPSTISNQFPA